MGRLFGGTSENTKTTGSGRLFSDGGLKDEYVNNYYSRIKKEEQLKNALNEQKRYEEENQKAQENLAFWQSIADVPKNLWQGVKQTGAGILDIAERVSPIEPARQIYGGVKTAIQRPEGESTFDAYKRGVDETAGRQTNFEKVTGKSLTKEDGKIDWEQGRQFIASSAEAPLYVYGAGVKTTGLAGKNLLQRLFARTMTKDVAVQSVAGATTSTFSDYKEGDTVGDTAGNYGKNLVANALLMSGINNIGGEIGRAIDLKKATKSLTNIEAKIGKLDDTDRLNALDALQEGIPEEKIIANIQKIKDDVYSPDEVAERVNDFQETTPEKEIAFNQKIADSKNETEIATMIKGKVDDTDIPVVSRLLKNVESPESVSAILNKYDPVVQNRKLVEDISLADTSRQVATLLKGKASKEDLPVISDILADIRDPKDIAKILQDFNVSAKALPVETKAPKQEIIKIPVRKVTQKEIKEAEMSKKIMPNEVYESQRMAELWTEMKNAEAGQRSYDTWNETNTSTPSSFPDWIPESLRRRKTLDSVLTHLENGTYPKGSAQRELYDLVYEKALKESDTLPIDEVNKKLQVIANEYRDIETPTETTPTSTTRPIEQQKPVSDTKTPIKTESPNKSLEELKSSKKIETPKKEGAFESAIKTKTSEKLPEIKKESKTALRAKEVFGDDLKVKTDYDVKTLTGEIDKADAKIGKSIENATKEAMSDVGNTTELATLRLELFQRALDEGDMAKASELFSKFNKLGTESAQTLNVMKLFETLNPHVKYMKDVVEARMKGLPGVKEKNFREGSDKILNETKEQILKEVEVGEKEVKSLLDTLTCKI